jgi:hypothetical protein
MPLLAPLVAQRAFSPPVSLTRPDNAKPPPPPPHILHVLWLGTFLAPPALHLRLVSVHLRSEAAPWKGKIRLWVCPQTPWKQGENSQIQGGIATAGRRQRVGGRRQRRTQTAGAFMGVSYLIFSSAPSP